MTRTDGEHELVLGNKQLLSTFFVVVVLLGVFFTMGYFVGKNTATNGFNSGPSAAAGGPRMDPAGKALDSGSSAPSSAPDSTAAAIDPNASATPAPEAVAPAVTPPAESKAEEKPEPKSARSEPKSEETNPSTETMAQPSSEQRYLQVSAVRRSDADNMVKVLRERGFPALLGESSKLGLYRVLVGPFKTTGELGRTKADLKAKGFESIVAK
jgi:cell division septation protein DedD